MLDLLTRFAQSFLDIFHLFPFPKKSRDSADTRGVVQRFGFALTEPLDVGNQHGLQFLSLAALARSSMKLCGFSHVFSQPCCPRRLPRLGWKVAERSLLLPLHPLPSQILSCRVPRCSWGLDMVVGHMSPVRL